MQIQKLISLPPVMVDRFHQLEKKDKREWFCGSDPNDRRAGSGGGTAHILVSAYRDEGYDGSFTEWLTLNRRLVIHSGGEGRRLPAYAPGGKSLLPLPVFRWSKGQYIDQKLLDFQASYYERIMKRAPEGYCTLVGSGDVMFISGDRFSDLPDADVLLFGVWVEDSVASRHGVFFSRRDTPETLAFVRQKPSLEELGEFAREHLYLMDSGIVLFSRKAIMALMKKCGWDEQADRFTGGVPDYYDLYGEMLSGFGTGSDGADPVLGELDVKVVPIQDGEFYHFGSNADLLQSAFRLQNRITDQRLRYVREADRHPSVFLQNSETGISFGNENHHIWIENSYLPASWRLDHHHIITGVPENRWKISLPTGICLDVVPLSTGKLCLRVYGYGDRFLGSLTDGEEWMGQSLEDWMFSRSIHPGNAGFDPNESIFSLPLFPVVEPDEIQEMINTLVRPVSGGEKWLHAKRLSGKELSDLADPEKLYRQREKLKASTLSRLIANYKNSIFYFMDLEKAAGDFRRLGLELHGELTNREPVIRRISDCMFRSRINGNSETGREYERRAFGILREEMVSTLKSSPVKPERNLMDDQIIWGRSPVRLDLAGGWTDTPPYCIMEGGTVINLSVELNGQMPLQVYARPLKKNRIILRSIDLGKKLEISSYEELNGYSRPGGDFSIPLAALVLAGFGPEFSTGTYPDLVSQLEAFGGGIEMTLLAAIPKGSGLGTSSNLAAAVLGTLNDLCGLNWDKHEIAYRTLILEQMLTTGGGWQDQYGGIFEGVKLLETVPGIIQRPSIKWLPGQLFSSGETRGMMLLYYTGVTREARDILGEIVKRMFLNTSGHLDILSEMQQHTRETFEIILRNDYEGLAEMVAGSWELNKRLDEGTNPPEIRHIIGRVDDYLLGYKLLGAGGGGYLLMFAKTADAAIRVKRELSSNRPNSRARFVDFAVSETGFQVSRS